MNPELSGSRPIAGILNLPLVLRMQGGRPWLEPRCQLGQAAVVFGLDVISGPKHILRSGAAQLFSMPAAGTVARLACRRASALPARRYNCVIGITLRSRAQRLTRERTNNCGIHSIKSLFQQLKILDVQSQRENKQPESTNAGQKKKNLRSIQN